MNSRWIEDSFALTGQAALVTGAAKGIGSNIATSLAAAGAELILVGRTTDSLGHTSAEVEKLGSRPRLLECDLSDAKSVDLLLNELAKSRVDILVNNAGTIHRAPATEIKVEDKQRVLEVNLNSIFTITQRIGAQMVERRKGRIINIASLLSFQGGINVAPYVVSKHGILGLTRALANEWGGFGVNVNAIAPGYIATDNTKPLQDDRERSEGILKRIPLGRWGNPEDIGAVAVFLASRAAQYINGEIITVDGGWMSR